MLSVSIMLLWWQLPVFTAVCSPNVFCRNLRQPCSPRPLDRFPITTCWTDRVTPWAGSCLVFTCLLWGACWSTCSLLSWLTPMKKSQMMRLNTIMTKNSSTISGINLWTFGIKRHPLVRWHSKYRTISRHVVGHFEGRGLVKQRLFHTTGSQRNLQKTFVNFSQRYACWWHGTIIF